MGDGHQHVHPHLSCWASIHHSKPRASGVVLIPAEVNVEIERGRDNHSGIPAVGAVSWAAHIVMTDEEEMTALRVKVALGGGTSRHLGESAVIACASHRKLTAVLDDRAAVAQARRLRVASIDTMWIVAEAYKSLFNRDRDQTVALVDDLLAPICTCLRRWRGFLLLGLDGRVITLTASYHSGLGASVRTSRSKNARHLVRFFVAVCGHNHAHAVGDLVRNVRDQGMTQAPTRCLYGHPPARAEPSPRPTRRLSPSRRRTHAMGLQNMRRSRVRSPLAAHCTALEGPGSVRIPSRRH